jgi:transposase
VDKINQRLPTTDKANVTMGQRVLAMILNGLGFTNDRLYLVPRFFQNKPVDRLIGPGIESEHLNDDALGRCLDAIATYGTTRLFFDMAFEIGTEQGLLGKSSHLDTTSLTLQGNYLIIMKQ